MGEPYPETGGYIVPTLYDYADATGDDRFRERADEMAAWLLTRQFEDGSFPGGTDPDETDPSVFNTGQIRFGLCRAFEETGEARYREVADERVAFLKTHQRMDCPAAVRGGLRGSDPVWGRYMYLRYPNWAAKSLADAVLLAERHADREYEPPARIASRSGCASDRTTVPLGPQRPLLRQEELDGATLAVADTLGREAAFGPPLVHLVDERHG